MPIAKKIDETIAMLKKRLRAEESFDLIYRTMTIGGKGGKPLSLNEINAQINELLKNC